MYLINHPFETEYTLRDAMKVIICGYFKDLSFEFDPTVDL